MPDLVGQIRILRTELLAANADILNCGRRLEGMIERAEAGQRPDPIDVAILDAMTADAGHRIEAVHVGMAALAAEYPGLVR